MASRFSETDQRASLRGRAGPWAVVALTVMAATAGGMLTLAARQAAGPQPRQDAAQRAAERIRAFEREADALVAQEGVLIAQLRRFEVERQIRIEELGQIARDRAATEQAIVDADAGAEALRRSAAAERPEIEGRLVRVYKLGRLGFWRLLLDVDDLRSLGRAYRTAAALTRIDRDRVADHERTLGAIARQQTELRERMTRVAALETRARAARAAAEQAVASRSALVAAIDARRDLNAQLAGELHTAQQRLQASVGRLDERGTPVVLPLRAFQGALPWPAHGASLASFGQSSGGARPSQPRTGIELALLEGQPVRAVHDGTVAFAGPFAGYGNLVIVEHGDRTHSLYGYLSSVSVGKGRQHRLAGSGGSFRGRSGGNARPVLRVARRRKGGRSHTMAGTEIGAPHHPAGRQAQGHTAT